MGKKGKSMFELSEGEFEGSISITKGMTTLDKVPNAIDNKTLNMRSSSRTIKKKPTTTNHNNPEEGIETEPKIPRQAHDNRKLRFSRPLTIGGKVIERQDGTSFDYIEISDVKKYIAQRSETDDLEDSSCDELEEEEFQKEEEIKKAYNRSSNSSRAQPRFEQTSSDDDRDLFGENDRDLLSPPPSSSNSNKMNDWGVPRQEEEEDSDKISVSSKSEYIINQIPVSTNLKLIEDSRNNFVSKKEKRKKRGTRFCFGCMWQDPHTIGIDKNAVSNIMNNMYRLYGSIKTLELARIIHLQFMKDVYHPIKEEIEIQRRDFAEDINSRQKIPIWRTYQIYEHLTSSSHVKDPRFFIVNSIEMFSQHQKIIEKTVYTYNRTKGDDADTEFADVNEKSLNLILRLNKRIEELYSKNPKTMNFYNDKLPINLSQGGAVVNLHKNFKRTQ